MEVRSMHYDIIGLTIALGNSDNGLVEGYSAVSGVVKIPYSDISKYEDKHRATEWLKERYRKKNVLYGFVLKEVEIEQHPFTYPKSPGIWFNVAKDIIT
jgi:hypothetical protein